MSLAARPLIGREHELALFHEAIVRAETGVGGLWLVVGEPGIGKSRLLDEVGREAERRGFTIALGRAWESGGAPAFWPWVLVLRSILRRRGRAVVDARRAAALAQILPELRSAPTESDEIVGGLAPDEACFRLLDAVVGVVLDAAEGGALCVLLEDLHAADPSSLLVLELLAAQARTAPVVVIATHRESLATTAPATAHLVKLARMARTVALRRLDRDHVGSYLERVLPQPPRTELVDAVHAACEGNSLFMVELAQWLAAGRTAEALVIPSSLRAIVRERCHALTDDARQLLDHAAVLGRQFDVVVLLSAAGRSASECDPALQATFAAGLLEPADALSLRFSHALVREALYADIGEGARAALHLRAAEACIACNAEPEPRWSELAHHLLAAGPAHRERAIEAAVCAAERASAQLAFDEAGQWLSRALAQLDGREPLRRAELLLSLGRARLLTGDIEEGRRLCAEAADLARDAGAVMLFARAALEYGAVFLFGDVNHTLIALLREAQERLEDPGMRARVLARLAAALQPASDPQIPIAMAREAIASARATGDAHALLDVLRSAGSALADLAPANERRTLDREHAALAERLGDATEAHRGASRLVFDALELGRLAEAETAAETCERHASRIGVPHVLWRAAAMRAVVESFRGNMTAAFGHCARASSLARQARDPNAERSLALQRALLIGFAGRRRDARDATAAAILSSPERSFPKVLTDTLEAMFHDPGEAVGVDPGAVAKLLAGTGISLMCCAAQVAIVAGDREAAITVHDRLEHDADHFVSFGMSALFVGPPVGVVVGKLRSFLGRDAPARAAFVQAYERARAVGARPGCAWAAYEHARHIAQRDPTEVEPRRALLASALEHAIACELDGLRERIEQELATFPGAEPVSASHPPVVDESPQVVTPAAPSAAGPSLRRFGDVWELVDGADVVHLRDTRGLRILARLMETPGLPILSLELSSELDGPIVVGDAGPMIDATARNAYRKRVADLREELAEAQEWNDIARVERIEGELAELEAELSRSVGLGGRLRRVGAASERARVNVQRRIRDVLRRIAAVRPELARRLERAVRTGTSCCYDP